MTRSVEAALADLADAARRGRTPDAYLARQVLLALGQALRADAAGAAPLIERIRSSVAPLEPAWTRAVQDELMLAIGEFAQCLDPRFLDHPDYDMEYTAAARERLDDRLAGARALHLDPRPRDSEVLVLADRVHAAALDKRDARGAEAARTPAAEPRPGSR